MGETGVLLTERDRLKSGKEKGSEWERKISGTKKREDYESMGSEKEHACE